MDLQRMVTVQAEDWVPAALVMAREEILRRGAAVLGAQEFLEHHPEEAIDETGFCGACTQVSVGREGPPRFSAGLVGVAYRISREECPRCGARAGRAFVSILGIPSVPLGRYMVQAKGRDWFYGRYTTRAMRR